jgi:hypothetical protein
MSDFLDYTFEEIPVVLNGRDYSATGTLCVEYITHRAHLSVGDRGGPEIMGFSDLRVELAHDDGEVFEVLSGEMEILTLLLRQIIPQIDQEYIFEEIDAARGSF